MTKTKLNFITFVLHPGWVYSINDGDWHYITFSMLKRLHHLKPNFICFDVNKIRGVDCGNFVHLYPHAIPAMYEWISFCIYRDWWDAFDYSIKDYNVEPPEIYQWMKETLDKPEFVKIKKQAFADLFTYGEARVKIPKL